MKIIKALTKVFIILHLLFFNILPDEPDWVKNLGSSARYPESIYATGFGMAKVVEKNQSEALKEAEDYAKANLSQKLKSQINSNILTKKVETETKLASYTDYTVKVNSQIDLQNVSFQRYSDKNYAYVLCYVKKEDLAELYLKKYSELSKSIEEKFKQAESLLSSQKKDEAIETFLSIYPLFRKLKEIHEILIALNNRMEYPLSLELDVEKKLAEIQSSNLESLDAIASVAALSLIKQLKENIALYPKAILYQDTKFGSQFSKFMLENINAKLSGKSENLKIVAVYEKADASVEGNYWILNDKIRLIINVLSKNKEVIASYQIIFSKELAENSKLALMPEELKKALEEEKKFAEAELNTGGLILEIWTNKGDDELVFYEGDTMSVFVRVNLPSYIRIIYHLADGKRALLADNMYVASHQINKPYKIPYAYEACEPFGVETMQVVASLEPLPPLKTINQEGFDILAEDLGSVLTKHRGMKKVKPKNLQTEERIKITVLKK